MQELAEFEKNDFQILLINVGNVVMDFIEASSVIAKPCSKVMLTESAFLALSDFFIINSQPNNTYSRVIYSTSLNGVVNKIYERITSKKNFERAPVTTDNPQYTWTFNGISKTWFIDYLLNHPDEKLLLNSKVIVNDLSYQLNEEDLPKEVRIRLGKHRLSFLYGLIEKPTIENLIPILPPWIYQSEIIKCLEIDIRCKNCLAAAGIYYFHHFFDYPDSKLLRLPNFGRKSYENLINEIVNGVCSFLDNSVTQYHSFGFIQNVIDRIYDQPENINSLLSKLNEFYFQKNPETNTNSESKSLDINFSNTDNSQLTTISNGHYQGEKTTALDTNDTFNTLLEHLEHFSSSFIKKPNYQTTFKLRLGISSRPKNLQEVGDLIGVTRERVRQIEKKILNQFEKKFDIKSQLIRRLDTIRSEISIPLTVTGLSSFDKWFEGMESRPWLLDSLFSALRITNYRLHAYENDLIIAPGDYDLIGSTIRAVKTMIQERFDSGVTKLDIEEFVSSLIGYETPELIDTVVFEATKNIAFYPGDNGKVMFLGSKVKASIANVLASSETALNCNEITKILNEEYGINGEVNYFRNICNTSFYQYAPSTFGLLKHANLSNDEINKIADYCFGIILDGGAGKQWHCDKLLDLLTEEDSSFKDKLDKYKLRVCLLRSEKFIDLGRMTFVIKSDETISGGIKRIEIAEFIEAILEKSPTPMHKEDIYKIIEQDRGLGDCTQIFHTGRLISTSPGTWGLIDKHLCLSDLDFREITHDLVSILNKMQHGLTESELLDALPEYSKAIKFRNNPYLLFSLGVKSKLCRREDVYLVLSEWDDCRRPTLRNSVIKALEHVQSDGMKLKQILDIAEVHYQHSIDRTYVNKILIENNFFYDEDLQVWKRALI